jgi:sigma54-dependent transcription regulator
LYTTTGIGVCRDSLPRVCCVVFRFCRAVVVWLFAHDMKHKQLILADYFDARRFRSVRASKRILRHVNRISGIKVTGKIKMEVLANRIAEISHMSRCTSDAAVYRPTLKIILHLRVLSRLQHSYGIPICTFAGTYSEAGGPYSEDCRRTYSEDCDRIRKTAYRIRKPTAGKSRP